MEQTINSLNVEVGVFLRNINAYTNRKDACIGNQTVALLIDAISCIDKLVNTAKIADEMMNETSIDFLDNLDERYFELRRNIVCRMCIETMPMTKDDFEAHVKKVSHTFQVRNMQTPSTQNLFESRSSKLTDYKGQLESSRSVTTCDESNQDKYSSNFFGDLVIGSTTEPNVNKAKLNYESVSETVDRAQREQIEERMRTERLRDKNDEQRKKEDSLEHVIDVKWKGVRVLESSDSESSDSSAHGFNYDSLYLVEVRGLPPSTSRQEVKDFFSGARILNGINGIHFILDEMYRKCGRALVQLECIKDYQSIHKYNMNRLGGRCIEVTTGNVKTFNDMIAKRKIPSKDRVIFVEGLPHKFNEQNIRFFFHGLQIQRIHVVQSASNCAYVKFSSMDDVEDAIKRSDKKSTVRIYRSTDQQMRSSYQGGPKHESLPSSSDLDTQKDDDSKSRSDSKSYSGDSKFVRVRGIPWEVDEDFVYNLFPGLEIDRRNGIQLEYHSKGRNTGTAFVEIKNAADFDMAMKANLTDTNRYLKVTKATKAEFLLTKEANNS
ncbi:G-rich sequence factor 1-like isoform X2 [Sitodiplosis mosellana]|uniref:G-rich sequence factor 1-like isoform X2 n=1 Tax=Sitodiplosis mosellana TaxID=263140 RepID=UPI002444FBFC|nr:G-rich sequence factor 1-like isoform X2 [Sitodiplosis mosellana]